MIFNAVLLFAGVLQALTLSFVLWKTGKTNKGTTYLICLIAVLCLQMCLKGISKLWIEDAVPWFLYNLSYELPLLAIPLGHYFVVATIRGDRRLTTQELLLALPFVYCLALLVLDQYVGFSFAQVMYPKFWTALVIEMILLAYCSHRSLTLVRTAGVVETNGNNMLKEFTIVHAVVSLIVVLALKFMFYTFPDYESVRYLFLALPVFMCWITYKVMVYAIAPSPGANTIRGKGVEKYSHSTLKDNHAKEIEAALLAYLEKEKPYLQQGLTIDHLAISLSTPRHHISQVLNDRLKKTFNDFVNEYRVARAKELLLDKKFDHLTIAGIAFECGFSSVSTFNLVFRKHTHCSPSDYKKQKAPILKTA